jgi:hypothetical protein
MAMSSIGNGDFLYLRGPPAVS